MSVCRRYHLTNVLWQAGANILFFPIICFVFATFLLMLGVSIGPNPAKTILILAGMLAILISRLVFRQDWRVTAGASAALMLFAVFLSSIFYDTSIDGQDYHFQAIEALAKGWNPFWDATPPASITGEAELWAVHYPMGAWLFEALLLAAGFGLESTKSLNFLQMIAAAMIVSAALLRLGLGPRYTALFTAAAIFNPVAYSQLFTRMNDGLLANCILIFLAAMGIWLFARDRRAIAFVVTSMVLALNLKFSALPIFFVLCAFSTAAWLLLADRRSALAVSGLLLAVAIFGVTVLGFSPYVLNAVHYGHPFYPVMGSATVNIMQDNTPDVLSGLSGPAKFLYSLFAQTHSGYEGGAALKLPLVLSFGEIRTAGGVDVRIAGFGPLFSAAVLLSAAGAILLIVRHREAVTTRWLLYGSAALLAATLVLPENWWARYVPHTWYIPLMVALAAVLVQSSILRVLGIATLALILVNAGLVAASSTWLTAKRSLAVDRQIGILKQASVPYCISPEQAQARLMIFAERGVETKLYTPAQAEGCAGAMDIAAYGPDRIGGRICPCPAQ